MIKTTKSLLSRINRAILLFSVNFRFMSAMFLYVILNLLFILHPIFNFEKLGYISIIVFGLTSVLSFQEFSINSIKKYNYLFFCFIFLFSLLLLIYGIIYSSSNRLFHGLVFLFAVPMAWFLLSNDKNRHFLVDAAAWGGLVSMYILLVISTWKAPLYEKSYSSVLLNPNGLAHVLIPMVVCCVFLVEKYLSHSYKKKSSKILIISFLMFSLGVASILLLLTKSRTGLLCLFSIFLFWVLYNVVIKRQYKILIMFFIFIVFAYKFTFFLLTDLSYSVIEKELEANNYAYRYVQNDIVKYKSIHDQANDLSPDKQQNNYELFDRVNTGISDNYDISSGRFTIWKEVIKKINFQGNPDNIKFQVNYGGSTKKINNPHNIFLSIGFFSGILTMIAMIIFMLIYFYIVAENSIRGSLLKKLNCYDLFLLMIGSTFFVVSNLSGTYTLTTTIHSLLFWQFIPIKKKNFQPFNLKANRI